MDRKLSDRTNNWRDGLAFLLVLICTAGFLVYVVNDDPRLRSSLDLKDNGDPDEDPAARAGVVDAASSEASVSDFDPSDEAAIPEAEPPPYHTYVDQRTYQTEVIADDLEQPDGLAVQRRTGAIYVSEEGPARILRLTGGARQVAVDAEVPVFAMDFGRRTRDSALRGPEGIAFDDAGTLYVAEDIPGGRILRFALDENGVAREGMVVPIPGVWDAFAWEDVACGPDGELLVAGSNLEAALGGREPSAFLGVLLFRNAAGQWWVVREDLFCSYSSVVFSKSARFGVYTSETTGEIGWVNLRSTRPLGGSSGLVARSPEGLCILPNGGLIVAEEQGGLHALHPGTDEVNEVRAGGGTLESVVWDAVGDRLLAIDDAGGRLLALTPDVPFEEDRNLMDFARMQPLTTLVHVPERCPDYLARLIALGGLDFYSSRGAPVSFRTFVGRVPLISANAVATPRGTSAEDPDPIEHVQLVVFEPNSISLDGGAPSLALAGFYARRSSGKVTKTLVRSMATGLAAAPLTTFEATGETTIVVPNASSVSMGAGGIATLQFLGLGEMPDFGVTLNPLAEDESSLVVFHPDGRRDHYGLNVPGPVPDPDQWVLAYTHQIMDQWKPLHHVPQLARSGALKQPL